jgi:hypothetical protein
LARFIALAAPVLVGWILVAPSVANAATSDWVTMRELKGYTARLKGEGRVPMRLDCKAVEGFSKEQFTRLCVTDGPKPTDLLEWHLQVGVYGTAAKAKQNLDKAMRMEKLVKRTGKHFVYPSFKRIASPNSGQAYACELRHLYNVK